MAIKLSLVLSHKQAEVSPEEYSGHSFDIYTFILLMPLVSIFGAALTNLIERSFKVSIHTNLGQMEMFIPHITRGSHSHSNTQKKMS